MSETVARYFAAFNAGDIAGMLDCLTEDIAHHVNEGAVRRQTGVRGVLPHMNACYDEASGRSSS
jgi:ketosteroid isomerase-like protein